MAHTYTISWTDGRPSKTIEAMTHRRVTDHDGDWFEFLIADPMWRIVYRCPTTEVAGKLIVR